MSALIRDAIRLTYGEPSVLEEVLGALDSTFGVVSTDAEGAALVDSIRSGRRLSGHE
jgi:hypothetical protein